MLLTAPIYVLAPAGLWLLHRTRSRTARDVIVLLGVYLLPVLIPLTNSHGWRGGWSPAARFLVPVAPLAALPILTVMLERRARVFLVTLVSLQICIDALLWSRPMLQWAEGTGQSPFILAIGGDALAAALPSLTRHGALDVSVLVGLAILWLLLTLKLVRNVSLVAERQRS